MNCDLMMDDPRSTVDLLIKSKFPKRIIVNLQSAYPVLPLIKAIKAANFEAGVSINPEGKATDLIQFVPYCDFIQIMTIEPGAQGNPFLESRLSLSLEIRDLGYEGLIGVDGGMNFKTLPLVKKYPIEVLSVGSSFSQSPDPSSVYKTMEDLVND